MAEELIGHWRTDPSDEFTIQSFGSISMNFKANGELIYTVHEEEKDQIGLLTYEIDGNLLVTNQPSHPRKEASKFNMVDGKLELIYDGIVSKFIKVE